MDVVRDGSKFAVGRVFLIDPGELSDVMWLNVIDGFWEDILVSFHKKGMFAEPDESGLEAEIIVLGLLLPDVLDDDTVFFLEVEAIEILHLIAPEADLDRLILVPQDDSDD